MNIKISAYKFFLSAALILVGSYALANTESGVRRYHLRIDEQRTSYLLTLRTDNSVIIENAELGQCRGLASGATLGNLMFLKFNDYSDCKKLNMSLLYYTVSTYEMFKAIPLGQKQEFGGYFNSSEQHRVWVTRIE